MQIPTMKLAAAVLGLTLIAWPALAGGEYEIEVTDHKKGTTETTLIQAEGDNLRIGVAKLNRKNPGGALIFQGDRREGKEPRLIVLDDQGGHMVINKAMIEQIGAMMPKGPDGRSPVVTDQMLERARRQIEQIADPEARRQALEQFESRFGSGAGGAEEEAESETETEYVERGLHDKHGYPTLLIQAKRGDEKIADLYVTDWKNIDAGRETGKAFEAFGEYYQEMMKAFENASGMDMGLLGRDDAPFQKILELGRFPVESREYENGELVRTSVLKSATQADLDPSVFKPGPDSVERKFGM